MYFVAPILYKMKNTKLFAALLLLSSLFTFSSCSPSFDYVSNTKEIITNGTWSVGYFFADADKTVAFKDYGFHFNHGGALVIDGGGTALNGTWQVAKDIEGTDVVHIDLSTQDASLQQLNGDWKVTGKSMVNVALKAEGHGNGQLQINKY
jgi:hypothetical protein